jgi:hypothetical protein
MFKQIIDLNRHAFGDIEKAHQRAVPTLILGTSS